MDRCLAVIFGPPLVISDMDPPGMQIDTPWPLEMETYERVGTFDASVSSQKVPLIHLAYCLSNGATIQLHATFSSQNTGSRAKCLSAAIAMVRANQAARLQEYACLGPMLGVSLCCSFVSYFTL
jgi:hypothetical protein